MAKKALGSLVSWTALNFRSADTSFTMNKIDNPYAELSGGQWLKGNLHTHTTRIDGARPTQAVIDD